MQLGSTENQLFKHRFDAVRFAHPSPLSRWLPNLDELLHPFEPEEPAVTDPQLVRSVWQRLARAILRRLSPEKRRTIDDEVMRRLLSGDLNPWEVGLAFRYPDYLSFTLDPRRNEVQSAMEGMTTNLARIKQVAAAGKARAVVLTVTPGWYINAEALACKRRAGYQLDKSVLENDAPDRAIEEACLAAAIDCISSRAAFGKRLATERGLTFQFDSEFNAAGHAVYGEEVSKVLGPYLRR
ncbi:MAG: hypothetical protein ACRD36_04970, partial [Candidatus Acidiferrum sp.]